MRCRNRLHESGHDNGSDPLARMACQSGRVSAPIPSLDASRRTALKRHQTEAGVLWAARALHEHSRRYNRDATKGIEHQQIGIAGHDHIGFAVHGQFQKLVILGITAQRDTLGDRRAQPVQ